MGRKAGGVKKVAATFFSFFLFDKRIKYDTIVSMVKKNKQKTDAMENLGKVLVNLGQILFATMFLGGVMRNEIPPYLIMIVGGASAITCIIAGILLSAKVKENKEE